MKSHSKLYIIAVFLLVASSTAFSQISRTSYFMETSNTRQLMNPALRPDQGFVGFPFLSNIYLDGRTNTFNLDNFTFDKGGSKRISFMNSAVSSDEFLKNIASKNYVSTDIAYSILSAGWYSGENGFWNVNIGLRTHMDASVPKDVFSLMKNGFDRAIQTEYNIGKTSFTTNVLGEIGVGYSRSLLEKSLTLGLRVKLLLGVANADFDLDNLTINGGPDYWQAVSSAKMYASAPGIKAKYKRSEDGQSEIFDGFDYEESFDFCGYGFGFDIGGDYKFNKLAENFDGILENILSRLRVSGALTDIGVMNWGKDNTIYLISPETASTINPTSNIGTDGQTLERAFEDFIDDMEEAVNLRGENKNHASRLNMGMNLGVEYDVLKEKLTAGFLYSAYFGKYYTMNEFTLSANFRPCSWFATSLSYSFVHSAFDTFGLAIHLAPSKGINLFLATDYLTPHVNSDWMPTTAKALNAQIGISFPMGGKRQ